MLMSWQSTWLICSSLGTKLGTAFAVHDECGSRAGGELVGLVVGDGAQIVLKQLPVGIARRVQRVSGLEEQHVTKPSHIEPRK